MRGLAGRQSHAGAVRQALTGKETVLQLPEIAIRRPVFATVLSLLVVLIGAVSFNRLSVR